MPPMTGSTALLAQIASLKADLLKKDERLKEHEQFRHQHRDCDTLSVENQRLRAEVSRLNCCLDNFKLERDQLKSCEVDAKRYQLLRSIWFEFGNINDIRRHPGKLIHATQMAADFESLDAVLDAHIAQSQPQPLGGEPTPRYYCLVPGCPGEHPSKWAMCAAEKLGGSSPLLTICTNCGRELISIKSYSYSFCSERCKNDWIHPDQTGGGTT